MVVVAAAAAVAVLVVVVAASALEANLAVRSTVRRLDPSNA